MSIELPPQAWPVHEVQMIGSVDGDPEKSSLAPFIRFYPSFYPRIIKRGQAQLILKVRITGAAGE